MKNFQGVNNNNNNNNKWTREKLWQMDQRTRKLMTMHQTLHTRDDMDSLYVSRKDGGRRLANIEDSVDALIEELEDCTKKRKKKSLIISTQKIAQVTQRLNEK